MTPESLERALGRIEGKLDALQKDLEECHDLVEAHVESAEPRLRSLELSRARLRGIIMTAAAVCGAIGAFVAEGTEQLINTLNNLPK